MGNLEEEPAKIIMDGNGNGSKRKRKKSRWGGDSTFLKKKVGIFILFVRNLGASR